MSSKMHKTIIVKVERFTRHPDYKKIIRKYNKFKVHDEKEIAKLGDMVMIEETRPLSKEKRFRLVKILKKGTPKLEQEIKEVTPQ